MPIKTDLERDVGVLQEQGRWTAAKLEKIEDKLDILMESYVAFKWKIYGGSAMLSFLITLAVELWRNKS